MAASIDAIAALGGEAPRVVFVSVDPERDAPSHLRGYVTEFREDFLGVTGPHEELRKLTRALGVVYARDGDDGPDYLVEHSAALLLVNPKGELQAVFAPPHEPDAMREAAARHAARPLLKVKLDGERVTERVAAVRAGAPGARIIVDANEAWSAETLRRHLPELADLGVELVEQPLPAGADAGLADVERVVPIAADESCHIRADLPGLAGRYDVVNVKLDKTGGLTEALALRDAARAAGFGIMVGCMLATSLAMAPALLVAQGARFVDLDGPLLLARDREPGLDYHPDGRVSPPSRGLWG